MRVEQREKFCLLVLSLVTSSLRWPTPFLSTAMGSVMILATAATVVGVVALHVFDLFRHVADTGPGRWRRRERGGREIWWLLIFFEQNHVTVVVC